MIGNSVACHLVQNGWKDIVSLFLSIELLLNDFRKMCLNFRIILSLKKGYYRQRRCCRWNIKDRIRFAWLVSSQPRTSLCPVLHRLL